MPRKWPGAPYSDKSAFGMAGGKAACNSGGGMKGISLKKSMAPSAGEGCVMVDAPTQKQAPVTLSGSHCSCTACGLYFNSDYAFCKHRVGLHMPIERRCITEPEMLEKGMCLVGHFWVSGRRAARTIPVDAISSETGGHSSVVTAKAVPSPRGLAYNRQNTRTARRVVFDAIGQGEQI